MGGDSLAVLESPLMPSVLLDQPSPISIPRETHSLGHTGAEIASQHSVGLEGVLIGHVVQLPNNQQRVDGSISLLNLEGWMMLWCTWLVALLFPSWKRLPGSTLWGGEEHPRQT